MSMVQRIPITLTAGVGAYPFSVCAREIGLGPAGSVCYYWLEWRTLRQKGHSNQRSCIDHWLARQQLQGLMDLRNDFDPAVRKRVIENLRTLVQAELYGLLASSKGQQSIFADAVLGGRVIRSLRAAARNQTSDGWTSI